MFKVEYGDCQFLQLYLCVINMFKAEEHKWTIPSIPLLCNERAGTKHPSPRLTVCTKRCMIFTKGEKFNHNC